MPPLRVIIFLLVITSIAAALYFYVGWRLIRPARISPGAKKLLWGLLTLLTLSIPVTFVSGRFIGPGLPARILAWFGFSALGLMGIFAALVLFRDLFLAGTFPIKDPSRRELLRRASGLFVLGAGGFIAVKSIVQAARPPVVEKVRVPIDGLKQSLQGLRIAQISDLHLGPTLGKPFFEDVVRRVNELDADIVAITGDLADGYADELKEMVSPLRDIRARHGVYFCTGNHEYYWDVHEPGVELRATSSGSSPLLLNDHRVIERDGAKHPRSAGVTDLHGRRRSVKGHKSDPEEGLRRQRAPPTVTWTSCSPTSRKQHLPRATEAGAGPRSAVGPHPRRPGTSR